MLNTGLSSLSRVVRSKTKVLLSENGQCVVKKECYVCAQEKAVLDKVKGWPRRSCREGLQVARGSGVDSSARAEMNMV